MVVGGGAAVDEVVEEEDGAVGLFGAVVVVGPGASVVEDVSGAVVEVELGLADVVVVSSSNFTRAPPWRTLPRNEPGCGKSPPATAGSFSASTMNRRKIAAGKLPPLTRRPRTLVICLELPSGNPIQTAVVIFGV